MAIVVARIKVKGKQFEIQVDLDEALKIQKGGGDMHSALQSGNIFYDINKGSKASSSDLIDSFGTDELYSVAKHIILKGLVQKNQEFRDNEKENKIKKIVSIIVKNSVDQHGRPYTEERIKRALSESRYQIDNRLAEQQLSDAVNSIKSIIPIKIETKRVKLVIPAQYTGQVYGMLKDFKESEEWLPNGSLSTVMNIPAGMQLDFYEKLNGITHGAVQSIEMNENK